MRAVDERGDASTVKFLKTLFGGGAEKDEEKGDELRLDLEYKDAAYFYRQALEKLDENDAEGRERVQGKLREVRRSAFTQLLEAAEDLMQEGDLDLAKEQLEVARNFADGDPALAALDAGYAKLAEKAPEGPLAETPDTVSGTDGDLFELALSGLEPEDRARALELGETFRQAYEACQDEAWEESLAKFESLLDGNPDEPLVLEMIGMVRERQGELKASLDAYQRARKSAPSRPVTVQGLAAVYRRMDKPAEALNVLTTAVAEHTIGPNLPDVWAEVHVERALALSEAGHHDDAVSILITLLEVRRTDRGGLYFNLAGVLQRAGKERECLGALERAIEASPRNPLYKERLADFLVRQGKNLDDALRLLIEANQVETTTGGAMLGGGGSKVSISPNRARYLYKIARVYFLKGQDLESERTITTALAVSRDPEVTKALEDLRKELRGV